MYNKRDMSAGSDDDEVPSTRAKRLNQNSFLKRSLKTLKLRQLLRDIAEARKLGVDLFTLSLDEFYARLEEARRQYRQHVNAGQRASTFLYDNGEDSEAGLDELTRKVLRDHDRHRKRRRSRSAKASPKRRRSAKKK